MSQLHIRVELPGKKETTYVFEDFPVRIGRSKDNHLPLPHPAVPRELCTAWLETDSRTIRVEERPGLKNPLLHGKTRVEGGISEKLLRLRIGPVALTFCTECIAENKTKKKRSAAIVAAVGAIVVLIIVAAGIPRKKSVSETSLFSILPKSPICNEVSVQCANKAQCAERLRLLPERAKEILSRRKLPLFEQKRAVLLLKEAAGIAAIHNPLATKELNKKLLTAQADLTGAYQQEIIRLRNAVKNRSGDAVTESADRLKSAIGDCDNRVTQLLERLIEANRESVEEK